MSKVKIQGHASGSGVLTVTAPNTSTDRTITLPDTTGTLLDENSSVPAANLTGTVADARISTLTASKLTGALPAISGASLTGINIPSGRKNIMFNGAMNISQRTTSTASVTSAAYGACDRYKFIINGGGTFTISQENDAPAGFHKSLKANCTTAQGSLGANDYGYFSQKIESQDTKHLAYGTSSAKTITLSFWVKCSQTGTLQAGIVHYASSENRHIGGTYTINAANTWEKKTMTFVGDTAAAGAGNFDTARGFEVEWFLISGSSRTGGSVPSSWGTMAQTNRNAGSNISIGDSTSDTWQITGVQLEVGDTATDFEYRSYGEELALCQRYYYAFLGGGQGTGHIGIGHYTLSSYLNISGGAFPVTMRTTPSYVITNGSSYWNIYRNDTGDHFDSISSSTINQNSWTVVGTVGVSGTQGMVGSAALGNAAGKLHFDAEL
jgi:hypothetical protein